MRKITLIFLLFIAVFANGQEEQEHSIIHLVRTKKFVGSAVASYIIFQNQQRFALPVGSVVDYKIYSTGEISIAAEYVGGTTIYYNLDVESGKEYYVYLNLSKFAEVEKNEIEKVVSAPKSFTKREENLDFPINKKSINKKNGPSQGSGFLVNNKGYVITNYHVVDGAKKITLKGIKGDFSTSLQAKVVSVDRQNDLALLKIESKLVSFDTPPYSIGNSKKVLQAEEVFAMGYPKKSLMGSETKVTNGIINSISGYQGSISEFQFSATIQPGNSGGPLLDRKGNIIGIVTSMMKREIAEGVGYAIKSNYIKFFLEEVGDIEYNKGESTLVGKDLPEQVKLISDFIYIIETE